MTDFDPFREQKHLALQQSIPALTNLAIHFKKIIKTDCSDVHYIKQHLMDLLQVNSF